MAEGAIPSLLPHHDPPDTCSVRFSLDGRLLAVGCNLRIYIYSLTSANSPTSAGEFICPGAYVTDICFSPDSHFLASSSFDNAIIIWNVNPKFLDKRLIGHSRAVTCLKFKPQSNVMASGSFDGNIRIWDVLRGVCLKLIRARLGGITSLDFTADGMKIVTGSITGACRIRDSSTGKILIRIKEQGMPLVHSVKFSLDAKLLLIGFSDSSVRVWSMELGRMLLNSYVTHDNINAHISSTFVRADEIMYLVSGSEDNCLNIWEVSSGSLVRTIHQAHMTPVQSVTSHPTRNMIVSVSLNGICTIKIWTLSTN